MAEGNKNSNSVKSNFSPEIKSVNLEEKKEFQINILNQDLPISGLTPFNQEILPNTNLQILTSDQDRNDSRNINLFPDPWVSIKIYLRINRLIDSFFCGIYLSFKAMIIINIYMLASALIIILCSLYLLFKLNQMIDSDDILIIEINLILGLILLIFHIYFIKTANRFNIISSKKFYFYLIIVFMFDLLTEASRRIAFENFEDACYLGIRIGLLLYYMIFFVISFFLISPKIVFFFLFLFECLIRIVLCRWTNPFIFDSNRAFIREIVLEKSIYQGGKNNTTCTICLEEINVQDEICQLKCHESHFFHYSCLEIWSKKSDLCPNCRQSM